LVFGNKVFKTNNVEFFIVDFVGRIGQKVVINLDVRNVEEVHLHELVLYGMANAVMRGIKCLLIQMTHVKATGQAFVVFLRMNNSRLFKGK